MVVALACVSIQSQGKDLAEVWKSGELWKLSRNSHQSGIAMRDTDASKSLAYGNLSFVAIQLGEVVFEWKAAEPDAADDDGQTSGANTPDVLYRVTCMIYNRGDDGSISGKAFSDKVKSVTDELSSFFEKKPRRPAIPANKNALKTSIWQWTDEAGVLNLESASSGNKEKTATPEFIRLVLSANKADIVKGNTADKVTRFDLRKNLTTDADGTVWIKDIPMVDQGQKGYCVPATVSRVFAYYGMDSVGMHELASLAGADADKGTSYLAMEAALKKIGSRYRVRCKVLAGPAGSHEDFFKDYNKEAKAAGKPLIPEGFGEHSREWFANLDGALWASVRARKAADVKKWFGPIRKNIDLGIPVIWSVFASGLNNREGREGGGAGGAHMRMIIGYNIKENTIVYSDSWGKWATKRVMTLPEAYSVTKRNYVLQP